MKIKVVTPYTNHSGRVHQPGTVLDIHPVHATDMLRTGKAVLPDEPLPLEEEEEKLPMDELIEQEETDTETYDQ